MRKSNYLLIFGALLCTATATAQQRISDGSASATINGGAILELQSNNKGLLLSRVNITNTTTWGLSGTAVAGMVVYNTNTGITSSNVSYPVITGGIGTYYWDGTGWVAMKVSGASNAWQVTGNTGTTAPAATGATVGSNNFWGTTDAQNLAVGTNDTTRAIFDRNGSLYGGAGTYNALLNPKQSLVWGSNNKDSANYTFMTGVGNVLSDSAAGSWAGGTGNSVYQPYSIAMGSGNLIGSTPSAAFYNENGYNAVFGSGNTAAGTYQNGGNLVSGLSNIVYNADNSLVSGQFNKDSSYANIVSGGNNVVGTAASYTIVTGSGNTVTNPWNIVGGSGNIVSAPYSFVTGNGNNLVTGNGNALIAGNGNKDSASNTLVTGQGNTISKAMPNSVVAGRYNKPADSTLLAIGNGTGASTQSNAVTVAITTPAPAVTAGNSTLNVNGSMSASVNTVTGNYTFTNADYLVIYAGTSDAAFTLPDPATCKGRIYRIVNLGGNGGSDVMLTFNYNVRIQNDFGSPGSGTSNTLNSSQSAIVGPGIAGADLGNNCTIVSDGTQWVRVGI